MKERAVTRKSELIALKNAGDKSWTKELQDELDELVSNVIDIDDQLEELKKQIAEEPTGYEVPKGTENMVHLSIVRGRRFNPQTGKEESMAYTQVFSINEFNLFKKSATLLGYSVIKVLHDPTGEAEAMVIK